MITDFNHAVNGLIWFFVVAAAFYYFIPFGFFLTLTVAAGWFGYRQGHSLQRGQISLILLLPLVWIFVALWGGSWWWQPNTPPNPPWVVYPVIFCGYLQIGLSVGLVWWLRGNRMFVVAFSLLNFYLLFVISFFANVVITGQLLGHSIF